MGVEKKLLSGNLCFSRGRNVRFFLILISISLITLSGFSSISAHPATRANGAEPEIEYLSITAEIDNNYATTEIREKFSNPYDHSIDETFSFQIPEKAFISNFSLTIDSCPKICPR